jgi:hypothetical protein
MPVRSEQGDQRDEHDRRDRPQEFHRGTRSAPNAGTLPRIRPHGTATATAVASPAAHASSVAARSVRNRGLAARPAARASTVEARGSTDRLNTPELPSI